MEERKVSVNDNLINWVSGYTITSLIEVLY